MPKKTKKQKILAEQRTAVSYHPLAFEFKAPSSLPAGRQVTVSPKTQASDTSFAYIKRDLLKTVSIGAIFIIGEFILAKFIGN